MRSGGPFFIIVSGWDEQGSGEWGLEVVVAQKMGCAKVGLTFSTAPALIQGPPQSALLDPFRRSEEHEYINYRVSRK